jgi:outer membrane protein OmpA-like peptidoglycan-associated protein
VATLQADRDALVHELDLARARVHCQPVDLALAEANLAFADVELDEGDARRAVEHLTDGRNHAEIASGCPADAPRETEPVPTAPIKVAPPKPATPTDKDGDGVSDADDSCPNDPEDLDAFKDADGCPELDNDNDGVSDSADRCPMQAEDRDNFEDADGCPDADNDRDGVADIEDKCPNEAGAAMDGGCPSRDRDHDGIGDEIDQCLTEPEVVNGYLDMDGCPDQKPSRVEITSEQIVIKQRINFATGKDVILPDSFPVLDDVAQAMKDYPKIKVEIGGHTDNVGDDNQNQKLSKNRADSVFEYLLSKGVAANRMVTIGYGETRPIDTNRTDEGRLNNRRVEFIIIGGGLNAAKPEQPAPTTQPDAPSPWQ